jgi:hypothetical protein
VRTEDDQLIVEAPSAEAALELVAERLGTQAKIAGVERVRRGGVGGFFARELVRVTATAHDPASGPQPREGVARPDAQSRTVTPSAVEAEADTPVDRLLRQLAQRDDPFAATLHRQLVPSAQDDGAGGNGGPARGDEPDPPSPAPAPPVERARAQEPARPRASLADLAPTQRLSVPRQPPSLPGLPAGARPAAEAVPAPLPGTPDWTVRNLYRLGLPPLLSAEDAASLPAHDDVAWTHALAGRLRPLCGPLPSGSTIVVGPPAERLAGTLDLPICWPGQKTPPESFVAPISGSYSEREWLASVRNGRNLHLVVGGPRWRGLLHDDPAVLSHDDTSMCEAVTLAFQLGIRLGYTCHASGELTRTNPIDIAVAIRRLLPTHR